MGQGFVILAAARAMANGGGLDEAIEAASKVKGTVCDLIFIDTMRYVYRSGRVPKFASLARSALNIKIVTREGRSSFCYCNENQRSWNRTNAQGNA